MKTLRVITTAVAVMAACTVFGAESKDSAAKTESKAVVAQTKCPVMGGKINRKLYADVNGKRIYVCCAGCIAKIKENPQKYIAVLKKQGVVPESVPVPKKDTK